MENTIFGVGFFRTVKTLEEQMRTARARTLSTKPLGHTKIHPILQLVLLRIYTEELGLFRCWVACRAKGSGFGPQGQPKNRSMEGSGLSLLGRSIVMHHAAEHHVLNHRAPNTLDTPAETFHPTSPHK